MGNEEINSACLPQLQVSFPGASATNDRRCFCIPGSSITWYAVSANGLVYFKEEFSNMRQAAMKIIRQPCVWCLVLCAVYAYQFSIRIMHWELPRPANAKALIWDIVTLYIGNALLIFKSLAKWLMIKKTVTKLPPGKYRLQP